MRLPGGFGFPHFPLFTYGKSLARDNRKTENRKRSRKILRRIAYNFANDTGHDDGDSDRVDSRSQNPAQGCRVVSHNGGKNFQDWDTVEPSLFLQYIEYAVVSTGRPHHGAQNQMDDQDESSRRFEKLK